MPLGAGRVLSAALLAALLPGFRARGEAPPPLRLETIPPDYRMEFFPRAFAPGQRRLLLALGGGGAKGIAHAGVLQRFQEEGIPVSGIAGTSMGAVMGSMYATGYSGFAIQALLEKVDLGAFLLDRQRRYPGATLWEQENERTALLSLQYQPGAGFALVPGTSSGLDLNRVLRVLLSRGSYFAAPSFDGLRVPFRAVSSDLQTGRACAIDHGELATAVQASMSIPGVFTPVILNGDQQVDGMLVQNLPVETARSLDPGAAVLAVEVGSSLDAGRENSLLGLAFRALDVSIEERTEISREAADLLLRPRTEQISYLEFHRQVAAAVLDGRHAFDLRLEALEQIIYGAPGAAPAPGGVLTVQAPPWLQARIAALVEGSLPAGPRLRRHYLRLLRRIQAAGLARHLEIRFLDSGPVLEAEPYPMLRRVDLQVPGEWLALVRQTLDAAGVRAGAVFNPVDLGRALDAFFLGSTLRARPLMSAEGTAFDAGSGVLHLKITEPTLETIRVDQASLPRSQADCIRNLLAPLQGRPFNARDLSLSLLLAEKQLGLVELQATPDPAAPRSSLLATPIADDRIMVDGLLAYESTWDAHGTVAVRGNRIWGTDLGMAFRASADRLRDTAELGLTRVLEHWPHLSWRLFADQADDRFLPESLQTPFQPQPFAPALLGRTLQERGLGLEFQGRAGHDDRGLVAVAFSHGWSALQPAPPEPALPPVDELQVKAEWDDFDRYLFPTQGALFRVRFGQGWMHPAGPAAPSGSYQFAYSRARDLVPLGSWASLEADLEAGLGWNLPFSRWYRVGGPAFLAGTPSSVFLVPNFAFSRLSLPVHVVQVFNANLQLSPRLDAGYLGSSAPGQLHDSGLVHGLGLNLCLELGRWYGEVALGRWFAPSAGRSEKAQVNVLLGTHPFDLWQD